MVDPYRFELKGRAFEDGDRLDKVASGLMGLQHVFDGQYRAISDKKRISDQDRRLFQVRITRYEDGSFIAYLGAAYSGVQLALSLGNYKSIWDVTKNSFEFLKAVYELAHNGKDIQISQTGDGNTVVISGDTHQVFNGPVYYFGAQIIGAVRELDDLLEGDEVARISLDGPDNTPIMELTSDRKGLFYPPMVIDETPVRLTCDIYDFNKYDNVGKARVPPSQAIPAGNYRFKNIGDQTVEDFILSMTEQQVTLSCLIKYQHDPLSESKIAEILVLKVAA